MEKRFLGLIEKSVKAHWNLPAFTDMEGPTLSYIRLSVGMRRTFPCRPP